MEEGIGPFTCLVSHKFTFLIQHKLICLSLSPSSYKTMPWVIRKCFTPIGYWCWACSAATNPSTSCNSVGVAGCVCVCQSYIYSKFECSPCLSLPSWQLFHSFSLSLFALHVSSPFLHLSLSLCLSLVLLVQVSGVLSEPSINTLSPWDTQSRERETKVPGGNERGRRGRNGPFWEEPKGKGGGGEMIGEGEGGEREGWEIGRASCRERV